jgi:hypothetical protein
MHATMDDYRWLVSSAAARWLDRAWEELAARGLSRDAGGRLRSFAAALVTRLRKDLAAVRAHLVAEQAELRWRALAKFPEAPRLFFTRQALEQATESSLAQLKAQRFADRTTLDLCCGVGGDLAALARQASGVVGVERDPVVALLAQANLDVLGLSGRAGVLVGDVRDVRLDSRRAWHCDPDRRVGGRRTTRPEQSEPSLETLAAWRDQSPAAAIKLACAAGLPAGWQAQAEWHWLGSRDECRQLVVWSGPLAQWPGRKVATLLEEGQPPYTLVEDQGEPPPACSQPQAWLFELHPVVRAAGLGGTLALRYGLALLEGSTRFLTGPQPIRERTLTTFELVDVLPWDRKQMRAYCRQRGIARLEIKAAASGVDAARLARELAAPGDATATLILARLAGHWRALVVRRHTSAADPAAAPAR